ncbi:Putative mitochondrial processing peptidase alpha subunit family protein [Zea mays]|uniref:Putative mitochondrial processing peptidase alpha subunit family protein n=1 Tax=Zea mays TaxID=4577 RepID=A0A1D6G3Y0_MAIZE|nr:Putative mitochondrial processing peptidase alpha subunit family protein [Zea mays]
MTTLSRMLPRLRSSATRALRKVFGLEPAAPPRRLPAPEAFVASERSLLRPLPGLDLPPCLPDNLSRSPTRVTTLPNGLRVATEDIPVMHSTTAAVPRSKNASPLFLLSILNLCGARRRQGPSACIGFFVNSGSVYESGETTGVSYLLERMGFKDTKHRSHLSIVSELELAGASVSVSASREQMVYSYDTLKGYMPEALEILIDCMRNPLFLQEEVQRQLVLAREGFQELQRSPERFLHEQLNIVGFSGALANPLIAPEHVLARINDRIIQKFYHENFTADRVVLAAAGVDHEHMLGYADFLLKDWHRGAPMEKPKSTYVGGYSKHRAYSDMTDVALAFEVPGGWFQERDAAIMTVIQTLMGGGGSFSTGGPGKGMHSRLSLRVLNKYHFVESLSAFSNVYDNTGLFGIYLTTSPYHVAKAVDIAISELIAVATPGEVTEVELRRAKNSTISSVLMNLESRVIMNPWSISASCQLTKFLHMNLFASGYDKYPYTMTSG